MSMQQCFFLRWLQQLKVIKLKLADRFNSTTPFPRPKPRSVVSGRYNDISVRVYTGGIRSLLVELPAGGDAISYNFTNSFCCFADVLTSYMSCCPQVVFELPVAELPMPSQKHKSYCWLRTYSRIHCPLSAGCVRLLVAELSIERDAVPSSGKGGAVAGEHGGAPRP